MAKRKKRRVHNVPRYLRKLRCLQRLGVLPSSPGVHHIGVYHDDWCRHWQVHGDCTCDPHLRLRWSQPAGSAN